MVWPTESPKWLENGPFGTKNGVNTGSKTRFFKIEYGPFGMLKQVFLVSFEPMVTHLGAWKVPKFLKSGCFGTKKRPKVGQKRVFPKVMLGHLQSSHNCF